MPSRKSYKRKPKSRMVKRTPTRKTTKRRKSSPKVVKKSPKVVVKQEPEVVVKQEPKVVVREEPKVVVKTSNKLYVILTRTFNGKFSCEANILGVFTTAQKALESAKNIAKEYNSMISIDDTKQQFSIIEVIEDKFYEMGQTSGKDWKLLWEEILTYNRMQDVENQNEVIMGIDSILTEYNSPAPSMRLYRRRYSRRRR